MNELVSKTQATINTTRALMAEVDRALARKMSRSDKPDDTPLRQSRKGMTR
jgi:hypothetical protein